MIIAPRTQFHVYLPWGQHPFSMMCLNSVLILNVKALVGAFNEKEAPKAIVKPMDRLQH